MRIDKRIYDINEHKLVLRSAEIEDAGILIPYLKKICGETKFLSCEADECIDLTIEQEEEFIRHYLESDKACLIIALLDDEYIGNASFGVAGRSRRNAHRAEIGIGLYKEYTGKGYGKKLFALVLETIKKCGFLQAELSASDGNKHAIHMYESFGFVITGRIPKANKYADGTYSDDIFMVKSLI